MTKRASPLGSSSSTEPDRHVIGRLGRPHGLDGFLGIYVDEEDLVSLEPGSLVYLGEHYATDVIVGAACAYVIYSIYSLYHRHAAARGEH